MSLTAFEREAVCVCNDETNKWEIFCSSGKLQNRMEKAGFEAYKIDSEGNKYYRVDYEQVSFRKKSSGRNWTPEQKQAAADRMRAIATKNT
ncbi:hypothetical protein [Paenibacillus polymyxa]|uniref:hypothetical protein n=1 Tax=Paenibacillus polymyxa TaxID=1406 RepID=UPI002AB36B89|nr:hypothetical protein [Paenibacillus polymyxa]MDY8021166.1 hypothetical protein [Paenibacillus polymyxa]